VTSAISSPDLETGQSAGPACARDRARHWVVFLEGAVSCHHHWTPNQVLFTRGLLARLCEALDEAENGRPSSFEARFWLESELDWLCNQCDYWFAHDGTPDGARVSAKPVECSDMSLPEYARLRVLYWCSRLLAWPFVDKYRGSGNLVSLTSYLWFRCSLFMLPLWAGIADGVRGLGSRISCLIRAIWPKR